MREGDDVTIVAIGRMVSMAEQAAATLSDEGIECEIVDPRTTSPLDEETIFERREHRAAGRGRRVEPAQHGDRHRGACGRELLRRPEGGPEDGDGAAHAATVQPSLEDLYVPDPDRIAEAAREVAGAGARA